MTDAIAGRKATLDVSLDGGETWTAVAELTEISLSGGSERIDATSIDSAGEIEGIVGNRDKSMSLTGNYIAGDAGQSDLRQAEDNQNTVQLRFRPKGTGSGNEQFVFTGVITDFSITINETDEQEVSIELDQTSGLTRSTQ